MPIFGNPPTKAIPVDFRVVYLNTMVNVKKKKIIREHCCATSDIFLLFSPISFHFKFPPVLGCKKWLQSAASLSYTLTHIKNITKEEIITNLNYVRKPFAVSNLALRLTSTHLQASQKRKTPRKPCKSYIALGQTPRTKQFENAGGKREYHIALKFS